MAERFVYQNANGVRRTLIRESSEEGGRFHIQTAQDLSPLLADAKQQREDNHVIGARRWGQKHMYPIAHVPIEVWERSIREGWSDDKKKWRAWLNDPDNAPLRLTEGRV